MTFFSRLAVSIVAALSTVFYALPAAAISYGGIGGRPAFPRPDNARTDDIFVHTLEPGAIQPEGVSVINNSEMGKTLMVYAADSTPSTDGGFACKQLAEKQTGVGTWITFGAPGENEVKAPRTDLLPDEDADGDGLTNQAEVEAGTNPEQADTDNDGFSDQVEVEAGFDPRQPVVVTVEPGGKIIVPFTITVPVTADVGELNGCILIQEKKDGGQTEEGIAIATRTGIRVAVTIPGEIERQLTIVQLDVWPRAQGGKILHPVVRNDGNVSIDATVKLVTKNLFGRLLKEHGGQYAILREATSEWNFELAPTFWGGWYRTTMTVAYDQESPEPGVVSGQTATLPGPTVSFLLVPAPLAWAIYAGILVLIITLVLLIILYQKRRRLIAATWVQYSVGAGDTIKGLAKRWGVSWKLLARVNRLKAPYELTGGMTLLSPPTSRLQPPGITA